MKKTILISLLCMLCGSAMFGATAQRTILSHKGKLTQYDANHWVEAISDAVAGDTVYFTSGAFGGGTVNDNLVIDKPITLIGAGVAESEVFFRENVSLYEGCATAEASSILETNITIAIPGSLTLTSTLMEGFHIPSRYGFEPSVTVTEPVTGLTIKRCQFSNSFGASAMVKNLVLEGCFVNWLSVANMEAPDIHNCVISNLYSNLEGVEYTNCSLSGMDGVANSTFVNCIIRTLPDYCTFVNCMYLSWTGFPSHITATGCWAVESVDLTKSQLEEGGYMGTDDTVVGPLGGQAPFMLVPSRPYVSSSSIVYNKTTKKLNVNVTVKKGQ